MFQRLLVPLDGSHSSAAIVPYTAQLAQHLGCQVDLLLVEPPTGARLPHPDHHRPNSSQRGGEKGAMALGGGTPRHIREANERYIARHVEEFEALGVRASGQVVCGSPVDEILKAALEFRSDGIAMATRKMSNFQKARTGSVAEEVVWRSKLPVLLIAA